TNAIVHSAISPLPILPDEGRGVNGFIRDIRSQIYQAKQARREPSGLFCEEFVPRLRELTWCAEALYAPARVCPQTAILALALFIGYPSSTCRLTRDYDSLGRSH